MKEKEFLKNSKMLVEDYVLNMLEEHRKWLVSNVDKIPIPMIPQFLISNVTQKNLSNEMPIQS